MLRSLLIAIDLSASSDRVLGRAALLPLSDHARVTVLHVIPKGLPARARGLAKRDAQKAVEAAASRLTRTLAKAVAVRGVVKVGNPAAEIIKRAASVKAPASWSGVASSILPLRSSSSTTIAIPLPAPRNG